MSNISYQKNLMFIEQIYDNIITTKNKEKRIVVDQNNGINLETILISLTANLFATNGIGDIILVTHMVNPVNVRDLKHYCSKNDSGNKLYTIDPIIGTDSQYGKMLRGRRIDLALFDITSFDHIKNTTSSFNKILDLNEALNLVLPTVMPNGRLIYLEDNG